MRRKLPGARQLLIWRRPALWRPRALSWRQRSVRPRCCALGAGADKDSALAALKVLYTCVLVLSLQACKVSLTAMEERFCLCSFLRAPAMAKSSM